MIRASLLALACCSAPPASPSAPVTGRASSSDTSSGLARLPAPFDAVDFSGTVEEARRAVAETGATVSDGDGLLRVRLEFASADEARRTMTNGWGEPVARLLVDGTDTGEAWILQARGARVHATLGIGESGARIVFAALVPLAMLVQGPPPQGIQGIVGMTPEEIQAAYGERTTCLDGDIACELAMSPSEAGAAAVSLDFEDGRVRRVRWTAIDSAPFAASRAAAAYDRAFGASKPTVRDGETYVRYRRARTLRLWIREQIPDRGLFCVGACEDFEPRAAD